MSANRLAQWVGSALGRKRSAGGRKRAADGRKRFRPGLEALEDRNDVALMVTPSGANPMALVQNLVGTGIQVVAVRYTGTPDSAGLFSGGTGIIGFEAGVVLSSGLAVEVVGPNDDDANTGFLGTPGDPDLDQIVAPNPTNDATVLEFDFIPAGSTVTFNYVFGSEEYNEFVNTSFNDVFAFFLNGNNVALVPGTSTPVAINTVNGGGPVFGNNPSNPQFYRNNDLDDGGGFIDTQLDGLTVVLTATGSVQPGQVNTIKLAVADTTDSSFDSAVFLQGSSMSSADLNFSVFYPLRYIADPTTGNLIGNLTIANREAGTAQTGPFRISLSLPDGYTLVNASGTSLGTPFFDIPAGTSIPPLGTLRLTLVLSNPNPLAPPPSTFFVGFPVTFARMASTGGFTSA